MSMWPEVVFWYLVVGVLLAVVITTHIIRSNRQMKVRDWVKALFIPIVWLPMVLVMMWEDR